MSRRGAGDTPVREPGPLVRGGPVRPQRRTHLFVGGNTAAAKSFGDEALAREQHAMNRASLRLGVEGARLEGQQLHVTVAVTNRLVGHDFPAFESFMRFGWVRLRVYGATGTLLKESAPAEPRKGLSNESPFLYRCSDDDLVIRCDTSIGPKQTRRLEAVLALPRGARASRVRAELMQSFDPEPVAEATYDLERGP